MLKYKILNEAFSRHKLIAFRTEKEEWGETIIGHVVGLEDGKITINEIDEYGIPIGFTTFKTDDILDIMIEDKTIRCLEILEKNQQFLSPEKSSTVWGIEEDIKKSLIDSITERKPIILFVKDGNTDDTNIIGFVKEMDDDYVLIELIDRYGEYDGRILIPIDTITGVRLDGQESNARWLLYQSRYNRDVSCPNR